MLRFDNECQSCNISSSTTKIDASEHKRSVLTPLRCTVCVQIVCPPSLSLHDGSVAVQQ